MTIRLAHLAGLVARKPAAAPCAQPVAAAKVKPAAKPRTEAPSRFAHLRTTAGNAIAFVRSAAERQPLNKEAEASRRAAKILAQARANGARF